MSDMNSITVEGVVIRMFNSGKGDLQAGVLKISGNKSDTYIKFKTGASVQIKENDRIALTGCINSYKKDDAPFPEISIYCFWVDVRGQSRDSSKNGVYRFNRQERPRQDDIPFGRGGDSHDSDSGSNEDIPY